MTITYDVNEYGQQNIPGVVHVDNTARIQTVNKQQNPLFYELLEAMKTHLGHGGGSEYEF